MQLDSFIYFPIEGCILRTRTVSSHILSQFDSCDDGVSAMLVQEVIKGKKSSLNPLHFTCSFFRLIYTKL